MTIRMASTSGTILLNNIRFKNNTAEEEGGALNLESVYSVQVKETTFENNRSPLRGGAVFVSSVISSSEVSFIGVRFQRNAASEGGAMYVGRFSDVSIATSTLTQDVASSGSAIFTTSATMLLSSVTIRRSIAQVEVVHCVGSFLTLTDNCKIQDNTGLAIVKITPFHRRFSSTTC